MEILFLVVTSIVFLITTAIWSVGWYGSWHDHSFNYDAPTRFGLMVSGAFMIGNAILCLKILMLAFDFIEPSSAISKWNFLIMSYVIGMTIADAILPPARSRSIPK